MSRVERIVAPEYGYPPIRLRASVSSSAPTCVRAEDEVEISRLGGLLSELESYSGIRLNKVKEIHDSIARGEYLTEPKIDRTVNAILRDLIALDEPGE